MQKLERIFRLPHPGCLRLGVYKKSNIRRGSQCQKHSNVNAHGPGTKGQIREFGVNITVKNDEFVGRARDPRESETQAKRVEQVENQAGRGRVPGNDVLVSPNDRILRTSDALVSF